MKTKKYTKLIVLFCFLNLLSEKKLKITLLLEPRLDPN